MSAEPDERPGRPLPIVISIQSQVAWGHVGNSAAAWPMRACGVEVIEVPTALLSNHPHYPSMRGRLLDPDLVGEILSGLAERGIHQRATAILSGFMGQAGTASMVAAFVRQAKDANPDLLYACDPVMGDADLGFFADATLRKTFAEDLVPLADLILPNAFELEALSGIPIDGPDAVAAARAALCTPAVVATSVPVAGQINKLATVVADGAGCTSIEVSRLPVRPAGTGDLLSGLTVAQLALGFDLNTAASRAVAGVEAALAQTSGEPWAEMPIAAAIDAIVNATGRETIPESGTEQMR